MFLRAKLWAHGFWGEGGKEGLMFGRTSMAFAIWRIRNCFQLVEGDFILSHFCSMFNFIY